MNFEKSKSKNVNLEKSKSKNVNLLKIKKKKILKNFAYRHDWESLVSFLQVIRDFKLRVQSFDLK